MLSGVAVIVIASLVVCVLAAVLVDMAYQAIVKKHWLGMVPLVCVVAAVGVAAASRFG